MKSVRGLNHEDYTVVFCEPDVIKDVEYSLTLRQTQNGDFISDESILELWQESNLESYLKKIALINSL